MSSMTTGLFALTLTLAPLRPATAGDCSDGGPDAVRELEAFARGKLKQAPEPDDLCIEDGVTGNAKLTRRFLAACETIVARDPKDRTCIRWSIELGARQLGAFDLFAAVGTVFPIEPFVYGNHAGNLYVKLDDARAMPLMLDAWRMANADKRAKLAKHAHNFTVFRHAAIKLLANHGGAIESAFIAEQSKLITDRGIRRAIAKAIAAIDKRARSPR